MKKGIFKRIMAGFMAVAVAVPVLANTAPDARAAEKGNVNLALGKTVTAAEGMPTDGLNLVTDGSVARGWERSYMYHTFPEAEDTETKPYITVDLGESFDIGKVVYFGVLPPDAGYYNTSHNMVIQVSNDPTFKDESTKTVYNTDVNNFFGLGVGTDIAGQYQEPQNTEAGITVEFETTNARYIRYYQHGSTQQGQATNCWPNALTAGEIEAYAPREEIIIEGENLSQDSQASASSTYPGYTAQAVADGDKETQWASAGGDYNGGHSPWVLLEWEYLVEINGVNLVDRGNATDAIPDGLLEWGTEEGVTAGSKSVGALEWRNQSDNMIKLDEPVKATWIKFTIDPQDDNYVHYCNRGLSEFQVFGQMVESDITSFEKVSVLTKPGIAPKLPETVTAIHDTGYTTEETVVWDPVKEEEYAKEGNTFTVYGTVAGTDIRAEAEVLVVAQDEMFIQAGTLTLRLDYYGKITNLLVNGKEYYSDGPDGKARSLVSLIADYEVIEPDKATYDEEKEEITFYFNDIQAQAIISLADKGNYTTMTLTELSNPNEIDLQAILWGPLKTTINNGGQTVGAAYDNEYAIGMHMLNTKTVGGWPKDFADYDYVPDISFPDPRVCRDYALNTVAFSTWGSAIRAYTWDYTEDSVIEGRVQPAMTGTFAEDNADMIGSSVALYGTRKDNILNVISNIQLTENLPHTTIDGEWQKTSIKTAQDFLVFNDAIWGNVENDAQMANDAGINYIYGQYGASGPWNGDGSYSFNNLFGGSDDAVKQMVETAEKYGVYIGTHTLSNLISGGTQYTSPYATSGLSFTGFATLTRDIGANDKEIYVDDGSSLGGTGRIRIGDELIGFSSNEQISDNEWKLTVSQRGAWTTPGIHLTGETAYSMWSYYTAPFIGGLDAVEPMTDRMGEIYSDLGVHCMSYDSFESMKMTAYGALVPSLYLKNVWQQVNDKGKSDGFITEASDMTSNVWDVHSRISWGESNTDVNMMMNYMSYYRLNFFPGMLGWMYDHGGHGGYGGNKSQLLMNLSMKGGWNAGAGWYVNANTFRTYPYMAGMLKTWNNAIQRGAFTVGESYTQELQDAMRSAWVNGRIWTLEETVKDCEWILQEVSKSDPTQKIGDPVTLTATHDIHTQAVNGDIATNVSLEYSRAHTGDEITVYVQPFTGHALQEESLKVNDGAVEITKTEDGIYTFIMPDGDVTISAEFVEDESGSCQIKTIDVPGGTFTVDKTSAKAGEIVTVSYKANPGYVLHEDGFTANGTAITGNSFTMPSRDVTVTARFDKITYQVDTVTEEHGTVTPDISEAQINDEVLLRIKPESGYQITRLTVNGKDVTKDILNNRLVFTMPAEDVEITAEFALGEYDITMAEEMQHGTLSFTPEKAGMGETVTVTANPDEAYRLKKGSISAYSIAGEVEVEEAADGTITFIMPDGDVEISAEFELIPYAITMEPMEHGTVFSDIDGAWSGEEITLTVSPAAGYQLKNGSLKVNGGDVALNPVPGSASGYTFTMPDGPVAVSAEFETLPADTYTIAILDTDNGIVSSDMTAAKSGQEVTLTVQAEEECFLVRLIVNGEDVTEKIENGHYTFAMPENHVAVQAEFAKGRNLSPKASASASSIYPGYTAEAVTDEDKSSHWACAGGNYYGGHTPWIQLDWEDPVLVYEVNLVDRGYEGDAIPDGKLEWGTSEGTTGSMEIGPLAWEGQPDNWFTLSETNEITWIRFTIDPTDDNYVHTSNRGLAEFQVYGTAVKDVSAEKKYLVVDYRSEYGTAVADKLSAQAGEKVTLTVTATKGYELKAGSLKVNDGTVDVTSEENGTYTFIMPDENAIISALFEKIEKPSEVNKTLLQQAYECGLKQDTTGVVDSAVEYFENAMKNAKAVLDDENATQEEVNEAWDNLVEAICGLEITQGDKTLLNLLIAKAEEMEKDFGKYVEKHWQELVDTLKAAKAVSANGDALQEEVDKAANALHKAILIQRYKANKDNLENLINKADRMNLSGYTAESVAVFKTALANAKQVLEDESLSEDDQSVVDNAEKKLEEAIQNLKEEEKPSEPSEPSEPDDDNGTSSNPDQGKESSDKPDGEEKPDSPTTGDNSNRVLWFAVAFTGLMATALVIIQRKKDTNHE